MSLLDLTRRSRPRHEATAWTLPQHRASYLVRIHVFERHRIGAWNPRRSNTDQLSHNRLVAALSDADKQWLAAHGWSD